MDLVADSKLQFKYHHVKEAQTEPGEEAPSPSPCLLCPFWWTGS